jgi:tripartite-type tricarboxylate transporter receptor subunit TctC
MAHPYSRRTALKTAGAIAATLGLPSLTLAQSFPDKSKPIKGIAPAAAGTTVDTLARAYAQAMSEILGTNVVIENRAGAEGVIGLQAAKTAAPDGYTIMFTSVSTQSVNPHLFKELTYDPLKDFIPLGGTMKVPLLMNAGPKLPFKTAREFVEAAKAEPGKYTYASISATTRLSGEMFAKAAGIKLLNVPYKSFADFVSDVLAGRTNIYFADGAAVLPYAAQGMRSLATATATRVARFPDLPTMAEQGVPGLDIVGWHAAYVPANTPAAVVTVLRDALQKAVSSKVVKDYISNSGNEPLALFGEEFAAFQRAEYDKWGRAVRDAGLAGTL